MSTDQSGTDCVPHRLPTSEVSLMERPAKQKHCKQALKPDLCAGGQVFSPLHHTDASISEPLMTLLKKTVHLVQTELVQKCSLSY